MDIVDNFIARIVRNPRTILSLFIRDFGIQQARQQHHKSFSGRFAFPLQLTASCPNRATGTYTTRDTVPARKVYTENQDTYLTCG